MAVDGDCYVVMAEVELVAFSRRANLQVILESTSQSRI
jgi:hypothetical protein